jgi:hypothetical protein
MDPKSRRINYNICVLRFLWRFRIQAPSVSATLSKINVRSIKKECLLVHILKCEDQINSIMPAGFLFWLCRRIEVNGGNVCSAFIAITHVVGKKRLLSQVWS